MGHLNVDRVKLICSDLNTRIQDYPVFIETGTYEGGTCLEVMGLFDRLYTLEITQKYYEIAKKNFDKRGATSITQILGDSYIELPKLLENINDNLFVWLDAHVSGDVGLGLGIKSGPLLEECAALNNYCKVKKTKIVVVIDDYRLFGTNIDAGSWDGISIENILNRFKDVFNPSRGVITKDDSMYFVIGGE